MQIHEVGISDLEYFGWVNPSSRKVPEWFRISENDWRARAHY
jgi:hypothetical protein